jgi:hypothetical protein
MLFGWPMPRVKEKSASSVFAVEPLSAMTKANAHLAANAPTVEQMRDFFIVLREQIEIANSGTVP